MDSDQSGSKIDKLTSDNYYAWKLRILHDLALKDWEDFVDRLHSIMKTDEIWKKKTENPKH